MSTQDMRVWFPIKGGFWGRTRRLRQSRGRRVAQLAQRPDARRGRRIRLGQDDLGLALLRLIRSEGRDCLSRPEHRRAECRARCGRCAKKCRSSSRTPMARCRRACRSRKSSPRVLASRYKAMSTSKRREIVARALSDTGLDPARWIAIRMNFPAASASASPSPALLALDPKFSCWTSRPRRSTCRCRRRSIDLLRDLQEKRRGLVLSVHQP